MRNKTFLTIFSCFFFVVSYAQKLTQSIRGKIIDTYSGYAVSKVLVSLTSQEFNYAGFTDSLGLFKIENLALGQYRLATTMVGYKAHTISEIIINGSKEQFLSIEIEEKINALSEIQVDNAADIKYDLDANELNSKSFTIEQTQRFAASFFDPARMVTAFPGIVSANDNSNNIVIRGNSPSGVLWRLEGVDIINPNHLSNGGTATDRVSPSGGGTMVLSSQLMGNSKILTSAFAAGYGNALSGIFDIALRKGNSEKREHTLQASFIGFDVATEGPFSKKYKGSYLINYRYSFTGLLELMGVKFGGETFRFQDLAINLHLPTNKLGDFTVFAVGGISGNTFTAQKDASKRVNPADSIEVNFNNTMGVVGATHQIQLSPKTSIKTSTAVSAARSGNIFSFLDQSNQLNLRDNDQLMNGKYVLTSALLHKFNNRISAKTGIIYQYLFFDLFSQTYNGNNQPLKDLLNAKGGISFIQPYSSFKIAITEKLTLNAGLHYSYLFSNGSNAIEPRANLKWNFIKNQFLSFAYGLHSQLQPMSVYFSKDNLGSEVNKNLGFTKAHHYVLGYQHNILGRLKFTTELYYQALYNVPIVDRSTSTFSTLNVLESAQSDSLKNNGTGTNKGVEFGIEQPLYKGWYYIGSVSIYDSKYIAGDRIERSTRFNGNYAINISGGKEIAWNNNNKNRIIGINLRIFYVGGFRESGIDLAASKSAGTTVFDPNKIWENKLPDYFRVDLRLSIKKNKPNYTRTLAIDIQNVTNQENIAYRIYDPNKDQIWSKMQLGLTPVLSYRVEF